MIGIFFYLQVPKTNRAEVEAEYHQVLKEAEELRQ